MILIDIAPELVPVGLFQANTAGRVITANDAFAVLVGSAASMPSGLPAWANAQPGDRAVAEAAWAAAADQRLDVHVDFRVWQPDGRASWVRLAASPLTDADGEVTGYAGSAIDVTDSITDRLLLDRLLGVLGSSGDAMIVLDRNGRAVYANRAASTLFGHGDEDDPARDVAMESVLQMIRDQVPREVVDSPETSSWRGEISFRAPNGLERTLDVDLVLHRGPDGLVEYWGGVARDVTATRQVQTELTHQANHDPLTGLPNRLLLLRTAADALERARENHEHVAMLFLDVDKLKDVNDTVGHDIGDALLVQVAARITHSTRPSDVVARIGGDEFVVLCDGSLDEQAAMDLADRIRHGLVGRVMVGGIEVDLTVSIGVAVASPGELAGMSSREDAVALLRNADTAMYVAKRRGRSRCELYTEEMRAASRAQKQLSNELEQALARGELFLTYQPMVSIHSGRVAGAEALLRWQHPDRGLLLPAAFLPVAEESGAIVPIGEWTIQTACIDAKAWIASGAVEPTFRVHVNVSARQLAEQTFVEQILASLRRSGLHPQSVALDVDEATIIETSSLSRPLQTLRRDGVRLALDGFGSGTSSLTALRTCGADLLKLDGATVRTLATTGKDDPVIRAVVQLAHALDMQVVALWVSAPEQLNRLRVLGCDLVQGNLIGAPVRATEFSRT